MGGVNSLCIPTKSSELCKENHARLSKNTPKAHVSAAFNVGDIQHSNNLLNINSATEEELMTLPGVNRTTAHNIVEYRQQIGGFKRVEDLALVSGVGAVKLESLRLEICVSKNKTSTSPEGSINGVDASVLRSQPAKPPPKKININTANVFQLMKVKSINILTAQNIVVYRDKKGLYRTLDDLLKVKGIGPPFLSGIRHQLTIGDDDQQSVSVDSGIGPAFASAMSNVRSPDATSHNSDHVSQLVSMCGPLTLTSLRPEVTPFSYKRDNRTVVRIASWNVQQLTEDKIDNPGVKEVICMTILENGFGVVIFQEVSKRESLQKICNELNNPTLPSVSKWHKSAKRQWDYIVSAKPTGRMFQGVEYNGILFDTDQDISLLSSAIIEHPANGQKPFVRKPFICHFKINLLDLVICSVHLKATGLNDEDLDAAKEEVSSVHKISDTISSHLKNEKDILILGDFNMSPDCQEFDEFRKKGYTNLIPSSLFTNISTKNMAGSMAYDNIWASKSLQRMYTGHHGVVREGLTNPWIPDGWSWGGVVSDHCPVWIECYVDKDLDRAELADLEGIRLTTKEP